MSTHSAFGPKPWLQTNWDWRAAGNFMAGGAGSGLLISSALLAAPQPGSQPWAFNWLVFAGLALVGLGLLCVWLEIGRPLRALHVFFNPRTSWMSREAFVAALLFPVGLLVFLGIDTWNWLLTLLALAFLYCQSRMLPAARGIPAWRPTLLTPMVFVTGLTEGCGVYLLLGLWHNRVSGAVMLLAALLVLVRLAVWMIYRRSVDASLAPRARTALSGAGRRLLIVGSILPVLVLGFGAGFTSDVTQLTLAAFAGVCMAFAGAAMKYTLVTRASFNPVSYTHLRAHE